MMEVGNLYIDSGCVYEIMYIDEANEIVYLDEFVGYHNAGAFEGNSFIAGNYDGHDVERGWIGVPKSLIKSEYVYKIEQLLDDLFAKEYSSAVIQKDRNDSVWIIFRDGRRQTRSGKIVSDDMFELKIFKEYMLRKLTDTAPRVLEDLSYYYLD